jgi:VIT1/CCC1 family predicted Fe2+/Mn2+ transporter
VSILLEGLMEFLARLFGLFLQPLFEALVEALARLAKNLIYGKNSELPNPRRVLFFRIVELLNAGSLTIAAVGYLFKLAVIKDLWAYSGTPLVVSIALGIFMALISIIAEEELGNKWFAYLSLAALTMIGCGWTVWALLSG